MRAVKRWLPAVLPWLLLFVAVADWFAIRWWNLNPPGVLAVVVGVALLAFAARLLEVLWRLVRQPRRRVGAAAQAVVLSGILVSLLGGMINWLLGLQGYVILSEGESAVLQGGADLQEFETGPLARLEEMDLVLSLEKVELIPEGGGFFSPLSRLRLVRHGQPVTLEVAPRRSTRAGTLLLYQGAFGFAPRIVITRHDETLFDRVVPFITERHGRTGISFEGRFTVAAEKLEIEGAVDLASLDEAMRGHATLLLAVRREGALIGRGSLLPGHFATLEDGYRIGFTGLRKWSEIDLSRRKYTRVMLVGAAMILLGVLIWPVARWRNW